MRARMQRRAVKAASLISEQQARKKIHEVQIRAAAMRTLVLFRPRVFVWDTGELCSMVHVFNPVHDATLQNPTTRLQEEGTILNCLESGQLQPEWDRHTLFIRRFHWLQLVSELERRNSWVLESHVDAF